MVFSDAKVEEETASGIVCVGVVLDEEGIGWGTEIGVAFDRRLHESLLQVVRKAFTAGT